MRERIVFAVNNMLTSLVNMGVLKPSQLNETLVTFCVAELEAGMDGQRLSWFDRQNNEKVAYTSRQ